MTIYHLARLFPAQIEARLREQPLLVMPIGTVEWHSHHAPLGLDGLVAEGIGAQIADHCDGVLAPATWWAVGGVPFPHTLNLPAAVIEPLLVALFEQFGTLGFRTIVAFTGHFGREQTLVLKRAALHVMQQADVTIAPLTPYDLVTDLWTGDHAGVGETSLLWALQPRLVRLDAVAAGDPLPGVLGEDPRGRASQEWGIQLLDQIAGRSAALALDLHEAEAGRRARYVAAMENIVRVLDVIQEARTSRPPEAVPELLAPAYVAALQALNRGEFAAARDHAARRLNEIG